MEQELIQIACEPNRLAILSAIRDGELCVQDLTRRLKTSQSATSAHLRILRTSGLATLRRRGKQNFYSLNDHKAPMVKKLLRLIEND